MCEFGKEMVLPDGSFKPSFDLEELIREVTDKNIEVTVYFEPGRTELSIQPYKPYKPICPFAKAE
jgi:hypothetical protein